MVVNKVTGRSPAGLGCYRVFDLFDTLGATEEQLDFPVITPLPLMGLRAGLRGYGGGYVAALPSHRRQSRTADER